MKQTYLDSVVTNNNLQLIKTVIPYVNPKIGSMLAIYIKLIELNNTIHMNKRMCPPPMMDTLKDFIDPDSIEMFESMMEIINMFKDNPDMAESMFHGMSGVDFSINDILGK